MAVTTQNNVIRISADNDTLTGIYNICSIVYKAGTTSPSVQIKKDDTSGMVLWESGTTADNARLWEQVEIRLTETTHFDIAGTGTVIYLYLEND